MVLYRYERGGIESDGGFVYNPRIYLNDYMVVSETPQGYWINEWGKKRWVSKTSKKRYAYPTKEEAMENFTKRTARCIKLLRGQLKRAEAFLAKAKEINTSESEPNKLTLT